MWLKEGELKCLLCVYMHDLSSKLFPFRCVCFFTSMKNIMNTFRRAHKKWLDHLIFCNHHFQNGIRNYACLSKWNSECMQSKPKHEEWYICNRTNFPRRSKKKVWIMNTLRFFLFLRFCFSQCSVFVPFNFSLFKRSNESYSIIHTDQKCLHKMLQVFSGESEKVATKKCWNNVWKISKKKKCNKNSIDLHRWCSISFSALEFGCFAFGAASLFYKRVHGRNVDLQWKPTLDKIIILDPAESGRDGEKEDFHWDSLCRSICVMCWSVCFACVCALCE